jgi:hypothetical protein
MTDHETLELRRIIDGDPADPGTPDVAGLRAAGAAGLRRRRIRVAAAALALTAAVAAPAYLLTGRAGEMATDPIRPDVATGPAKPSQSPADDQNPADDRECGVLSCITEGIDPVADFREKGTVVESVRVGTLPNGAEELFYLARDRGVDLRTGEKGQVDVLKAGYRLNGVLYGTAWTLQPGYQAASGPRLWSNPGPFNAQDGSTGHYVVLGYVDGAPDKITWSTPDGEQGEVDGVLRLDGYTAFYLSLPMPEDFVPPNPVTRNEDGSITVETEDGPKTLAEGELTGVTIGELLGPHAYDGWPPDLTIQTSDGWSCSLADCGTG